MLTLDKIYHAAYVLKNVARKTDLIKATKLSNKCELYLKTENILIPIFIHFLNNLVATILTDFAHIEPVVSSVPVSYLMLVISTVSGILMIKYIYDNSRFLKSKAS